MKIRNALVKPYYVYRPSQLLRRLAAAFSDASSYKFIRLPWDFDLRVNCCDSLGGALMRNGVSDLVVTEALFRLTDPGDLAVDVGANVGYMTSVMASRVGGSGTVLAFEPHPQIFAELVENVAAWHAWNKISAETVRPFQAAISRTLGEANLFEPPMFNRNRTRSQLCLEPIVSGSGPVSATCHRVRTTTIDHVVAEYGAIDLMKIDVEGHEEDVLLGAEKTLRERQICDVIFEELKPFPAATHKILERHHYEVFRIEERLIAPRLVKPESVSSNSRYTPPSYVATRDADRLRNRFQSRGWHSLTD